MQPTYSPYPPKNHRLRSIVIGVGIVLVSFGIAFIVSRSITPAKVASPFASQPALDINKALEIYPTSINGLQTDYQKIDGPVSSMVRYQKSGASYSIDVASTQAVSFTAKTTSQADTTGSIQTQTLSFFKSRGLTEQGSIDSLHIVLVGSSAVCELSTPEPPSGAPHTITLGCISQADADKEYGFINTFVGLYPASNRTLNFTHASRNLITSGNKSLSILRLSGGSTQPALLFAAIDNQWEYIAPLSDGPSSASNGKYTPSPSLTAALNNPKYGDFLVKNIQ